MFPLRQLPNILSRKCSVQGTELLLSDLAVREDPQNSFPSQASSPGRKYINGWRSSVILFIFLGTCVLCLNFGIVVWALSRFRVFNGMATVHEAPCSEIKATSMLLHLAINILSTFLLGASNFCMQILCAPTREEVDAAHARRTWLSIGVPSLKNLFYVDRKKSALWVLLGLSSIPLHLLWNSAVVSQLSSNAYIYSVVTEGFANGLLWDDKSKIVDYRSETSTLFEKYRRNELMKLDVAECIKAYGIDFNSEYGNLFLVFDASRGLGGNSSLLLTGINGATASGTTGGRSPIGSGGGRWMCGVYDNGGVCDFEELSLNNATHWNPWAGYDFNKYTGYESHIEGNVDYCLAEETHHPCRLGISPPILITVLVCNALKTVCFVLTLLVGRSMRPLVTNGDAIESFLLRPDSRFQNRCLVSKADVGKKKKQFWSEQPLPLQWQGKRRRWAAGATKGFWLATFVPGSLFIIAIIVLTIKCEVWGGGANEFVSEGFGKPQTQNLLDYGANGRPVPLASLALIANAPQIIVSYIYVAYNGLFTSMLSTAEWVGYSLCPRGLSVAWPKGHQRSRGFLEIPYAYGAPIMVASTLLHWLISQSLFLVRITVYGTDGTELIFRSISATGFSAYPIVFALSMGGAMLIAVLLFGLVKTYPGTMPLAACCSASIAASCQPVEDMARDGSVTERLQWGVVGEGTTVDGHDKIEHASFSTGQVAPLVAGHFYA